MEWGRGWQRRPNYDCAGEKINYKGVIVSEIITLATRSERHPEADMELRRMAVQITAQLPADADDALAVLDYARKFVRMFLSREVTPA